jgi:hypothetical protein
MDFVNSLKGSLLDSDLSSFKAFLASRAFLVVNHQLHLACLEHCSFQGFHSWIADSLGHFKEHFGSYSGMSTEHSVLDYFVDYWSFIIGWIIYCFLLVQDVHLDFLNLDNARHYLEISHHCLAGWDVSFSELEAYFTVTFDASGFAAASYCIIIASSSRITVPNFNFSHVFPTCWSESLSFEVLDPSYRIHHHHGFHFHYLHRHCSQ